MIRIITGILIEIGRGKIEPKDILQIIDNKMRPDNFITLPPYGLYFFEVKY